VALDVNLLRNGDGVVHLDAQIPHRALDLAMPEEQLDGPEIARTPIDERSLGSAQRVRVDSTDERNMMEHHDVSGGSQWRKWADLVCHHIKSTSYGHGGKQANR
jgi:hypothetical protein